ncbi:MAG: RNA ligase family protein, partial [Limisphaerales bacterium]
RLHKQPIESMGQSRDDFVKYPRTPHLFGSKGTADDKYLGPKESLAFVGDASLIVEEKLDGTNVGIHFATNGRMVLQCRGHEITEGMHPQYDLFKQWTSVKRELLELMLEDRLILFGEWLYARHSLHYIGLPHYFFEFDVYDKEAGEFLDLQSRLEILDGTGICTVPVVHEGEIDEQGLRELVVKSQFDSRFDNPTTGEIDRLMEGLYVRVEAAGFVKGRANFVRPEFTERVMLSEHWKHQRMVPNELLPEADIWK